jgi:MFS family permease
LLYVISRLGSYFADGFTGLLILRLLCGLATAAMLTLSAMLIGDYWTGRRQDIALSWLGVMPAVGSMAFLFAAGYLTQAGGWRVPFLLFMTAVPVLLAAALVIDEPNDVRPVSDERASRSGPLPSGMAFLTLQMFVAGCAISKRASMIRRSPPPCLAWLRSRP